MIPNTFWLSSQWLMKWWQVLFRYFCVYMLFSKRPLPRSWLYNCILYKNRMFWREPTYLKILSYFFSFVTRRYIFQLKPNTAISNCCSQQRYNYCKQKSFTIIKRFLLCWLVNDIFFHSIYCLILITGKFRI